MLGRLTIARKISLGFLTNVLLLVGLSGFAIYQADEIAGLFEEYAANSGQVVIVDDYFKHVSVAGAAVLNYQVAPSDRAAEAVRAELAETFAVAEGVENTFESGSEAHGELLQLRAELEAYQGSFNALVAIQNEVETLIGEMKTAGDNATKTLTRIMSGTVRQGKPQASVIASQAQRSLTEAQADMMRYLITGDEESVAAAGKAVFQAKRFFKRLDFELSDPELRERLKSVVTDTTTWDTQSKALHASVQRRADLLQNSLATTEQAIREQLNLIISRVTDREALLSQQAKEKMAASSNIVLIVACLAALAGSLLAIILPRRLRGLQDLREAITAIWRQESDIEIKGVERSDEVGEMARSLAKISEAGAQTARVTAAVASSESAVLILDRDNRCAFKNRAFNVLMGANPEVASVWFREEGDVLVANGLQQTIDSHDDKSNGRSHGGTKMIECQVEDKLFTARRSKVVDANGAVIGSTIELYDVTHIRLLETEVIEVIQDVEKGDFHRRVTAIDDLGFSSYVARGLNRLLDSVSSFMSALSESLDSMAQGDLTNPITVEFKGDFESAKNNVNANIVRLSETIAQIAGAVRTVDRASTEIMETSNKSAMGAENQASALEETAATMEEMSATIRANAQNATSASDLANQAREKATRGRDIIREAGSAMGTIEEGSRKISDIVSMIDSIAFQTNLLALNAAVEAARAGDAGKGFAVVASEVRALAQRASGSASDIGKLIDESSNHVVNGVALVDSASSSLEEIAESITELSTRIGEISESSREQSTGVEEINSAIADLDGLTQQNAATAQQSATNAQRLASQARELSELADSFKTSEGAGEFEDSSGMAA